MSEKKDFKALDQHYRHVSEVMLKVVKKLVEEGAHPAPVGLVMLEHAVWAYKQVGMSKEQWLETAIRIWEHCGGVAEPNPEAKPN